VKKKKNQIYKLSFYLNCNMCNIDLRYSKVYIYELDETKLDIKK
jgi:hypothetical protein